MKPSRKVRGVLHKARRMRSSTNGNPRFEVQIDGNLYRTKPDSDFAYDVLNLLGKLVEVTVKEYYGWPTIMYGGLAGVSTILDSPMRGTPKHNIPISKREEGDLDGTPIVAAGSKTESTVPQAMSQYTVKKSTTVDDMWYWQHENGMMEGHFFTEKEAWHAVLDHILEEKRCHVTKS